MRNKNRLLKLGLVMLCAAVLLGPADRLCGADDFYVIGGGSPWIRNGTSTYFMGKVGIGTNNPGYPLTIVSSGYGLRAYSSDPNYTAIEGYSTATTGVSWGVKGQTSSTDSSAMGVHGVASSGAGFGIYGQASGSGAGVKGYNYSATGYGVSGENTGSGGKGIWGKGDGCGVYGTTTGSTGIGVFASVSGPAYAVYGQNTSGQGYAGYFQGNFAAVSGTKLAIVATSQGPRKLYSQESPEVWFEDSGEGQLAGGLAHIDLDPLFLETVTIDDQHPMRVFIQLNDDCNGVYVQRQAAGFEVVELRGGASRAHFTYRVMAKRQGYENARLEAAPDPVKVAALQAPAK